MEFERYYLDLFEMLNTCCKKIASGKYDKADEPGQINHYQALSTALAATVGMGNISGVTLAIAMGGNIHLGHA